MRPDVVSIGQGPTVVMLHSSLSSSGQWQDLIGRLQGRVHCLAMDLYGYGETPMPATTVVVIDEVETDNWGVGGESVTVRRKRGE